MALLSISLLGKLRVHDQLRSSCSHVHETTSGAVTNNRNAVTTFPRTLNPARHVSANSQAIETCQTVFDELVSPDGIQTHVELQQAGSGGMGLFLKHGMQAGSVVLSVPLSVCIVVDYSTSLQLPSGTWPRLRKGLEKDDSLQWDILMVSATPPVMHAWMASE
jgi:hypothetical protein